MAHPLGSLADLGAQGPGADRSAYAGLFRRAGRDRGSAIEAVVIGESRCCLLSGYGSRSR